MLFLINDTMLDFDPRDLVPPLEARRFQALSLAYVIRLGQELFAEDPQVHKTSPERVRRLAALLVMKQPDLNAALFVAPAKGCPHDQVGVRFCSLSIEVLAALQNRQRAGALDAVAADREVWRRLAA